MGGFLKSRVSFWLGIGCCSYEAFFALLIFLVVVAFFGGAAGPLQESAGGDEAAVGGATPWGLSSDVPANLATLFTESGEKNKIHPALVAGIFLTEKHADRFGADISSLDEIQADCDTSDAGALGPMQLMPGAWNYFKVASSEYGITDPNVCRWRDSIYGGGRWIRWKLTEQSDTRANCHISEDGKEGWTDDCVKSVGRAYCGACTAAGCGSSSYNYCEKTLTNFKYALKDN